MHVASDESLLDPYTQTHTQHAPGPFPQTPPALLMNEPRSSISVFPPLAPSLTQVIMDFNETLRHSDLRPFHNTVQTS